jgi:hypothetical protein
MTLSAASRPRSKSFKNHKLTSFPPISSLYKFTALSFDDNPIASFAGFNEHPTLKRLYLNRTLINSFTAAPVLPAIEWLGLEHTALARFPLLPIMGAVLYSPTLQFINGEPISDREKRLADGMRGEVAPYLLQGWLLTNSSPVVLLHPTRRTRIELSVKPGSAVTASPREVLNTPGIAPSRKLPQPRRLSPQKVKVIGGRPVEQVKALGIDLRRQVDKSITRNPPSSHLRTHRGQSPTERKTTSVRSILRKAGGPSDAMRPHNDRKVYPDTSSDNELIEDRASDASESD